MARSSPRRKSSSEPSFDSTALAGLLVSYRVPATRAATQLGIRMTVAEITRVTPVQFDYVNVGKGGVIATDERGCRSEQDLASVRR